MTTVPSSSAGEPIRTTTTCPIACASATDVGLLLIRLIVGAVFIYHGSLKLFGNLHEFADFLAGMGMHWPMLAATISACVEFFGGIAILLGFVVRLTAIPMIINMAVAIALVHKAAFSAQHNGMEYPLTLAVVLLGLVFLGAGRLSLSGAMFGKSDLPKRNPTS